MSQPLKRVRNILKWFFLIVGMLTVLILLLLTIWLNTSPQFGGSATDAQKLEYAETGHYADGIFLNKEEIHMEIDCHSIQTMAREAMNPDPNIVPSNNIEVQKMEASSIGTLADSDARITWFGHSSFLIEVGGKNILIDPLFGQYASPHPWLGRKRFHKEMPVTIPELPHIDAVIISHDHYDHLDYPSIKELKEKVGHFFVPLGVGNHLRRWEIDDTKISELDWWDEESLDNLRIIMTPSRHMSGRGLTDQSATLWGSWIIQGADQNIYFSGDGGYGEHFKEIGEKYGPFDVGLMECGQYNKLWSEVHMMPEQTVQAAMDVKAELIVPIHWAAFALATHSWTDPIERFVEASKKINAPYATPEIGQPILLKEGADVPKGRWWEKV